MTTMPPVTAVSAPRDASAGAQARAQVDAQARARTQRRLRPVVAGGLAVASFVVYAWTGAPGVTGWESGELIAAAHAAGVPQAPGGMASLVPAGWWLQLPLAADTARMMVLWQALLSALTVAIAYLFAERVLQLLLEERAALAAPPLADAPAAAGASARTDLLATAVAALTAAAFAVSESFWANAVVVERHNPQLLFNAFALLCAAGPLAGRARSLVSLALAGIALGLATTMGDLWMYVLAPVMLLVLRRHGRGLFLAGMVPALLLLVAAVAGWPRAVASLPMDVMMPLVGSPATALATGAILAALILILLAVLTARFAPAHAVHRMLVPVAGFCLGLSLNAVVPARAALAPPVNAVGTPTQASLRDYFATPGEAQGGDVLVRRRSAREIAPEAWLRDESELGWTVRVQLQGQLARYTFWNAIGRASDRADAAPAVGVADAEGDPMLLVPVAAAYPASTFGVPLVLVAFGMLWSLRRMRRTAFALVVLLAATGPLHALGLNLPDGHARAFDGMFVAFFFSAVPWAAAGLLALVRAVRVSAGRIALLVAAAGLPLWMAHAGHVAHDRSADVTMPALARAMLASCDTNAVLYTAGDNDYNIVVHAQVVEGLRRDVRLVRSDRLDVPLDSAVRALRALEPDTPVHISAACDPETCDALSDRLRIEGTTLRVTNRRTAQSVRLDAERTRRALDAAGGLPADASVDAVSRAAAALLRETCLHLAEHAFRVQRRTFSCDQALDRFEHIAPASAYALDARDVLDAAVLAREASCDARADRLFAAIERACVRSMERAPVLDVSLQSAARVLLELYRFEHRYDDALALLDRIARAHPRAADVRAARADIEILKHADSTYSTHHTVATP